MPNQDGTGPMGQGAQTGRGKGPCADKTSGRGMRQRMRCRWCDFWNRGDASNDRPRRRA